MLTTADLAALHPADGRRNDSRLAAQTLRLVARTVEKSLPRDVLRVLRRCPIYYGDLPRQGGYQIEGCARTDGGEIILDRRVLEENADSHAYLEDLLAHELGHSYRARLGQHDPDEIREERETIALVKSWGFRAAKGRTT